MEICATRRKAAPRKARGVVARYYGMRRRIALVFVCFMRAKQVRAKRRSSRQAAAASNVPPGNRCRRYARSLALFCARARAARAVLLQKRAAGKMPFKNEEMLCEGAEGRQVRNTVEGMRGRQAKARRLLTDGNDYMGKRHEGGRAAARRAARWQVLGRRRNERNDMTLRREDTWREYVRWRGGTPWSSVPRALPAICTAATRKPNTSFRAMARADTGRCFSPQRRAQRQTNKSVR